MRLPTFTIDLSIGKEGSKFMVDLFKHILHIILWQGLNELAMYMLNGKRN